MLDDSIKVSKADKAIRPTACFPAWRGRKVSIVAATSYQLANYWDGGSRDFVMAYSLITGEASAPTRDTSNPFARSGAAFKEIQIPPDVLIVEHSIFCGKDAGIRIYVRTENMPRLLAAPSSARCDETAHYRSE